MSRQIVIKKGLLQTISNNAFGVTKWKLLANNRGIISSFIPNERVLDSIQKYKASLLQQNGSPETDVSNRETAGLPSDNQSTFSTSNIVNDKPAFQNGKQVKQNGNDKNEDPSPSLHDSNEFKQPRASATTEENTNVVINEGFASVPFPILPNYFSFYNQVPFFPNMPTLPQMMPLPQMGQLGQMQLPEGLPIPNSGQLQFPPQFSQPPRKESKPETRIHNTKSIHSKNKQYQHRFSRYIPKKSNSNERPKVGIETEDEYKVSGVLFYRIDSESRKIYILLQERLVNKKHELSHFYATKTIEDLDSVSTISRIFMEDTKNASGFSQNEIEILLRDPKRNESVYMDEAVSYLYLCQVDKNFENQVANYQPDSENLENTFIGFLWVPLEGIRFQLAGQGEQLGKKGNKSNLQGIINLNEKPLKQYLLDILKNPGIEEILDGLGESHHERKPYPKKYGKVMKGKKKNVKKFR